MLRGFVYSLIAMVLFIGIGLVALGRAPSSDDQMFFYGGWLLLTSLFAVGPAFFVAGWLHHRHLHPRDPVWDEELGE
jgi:hypothetical protein